MKNVNLDDITKSVKDLQDTGFSASTKSSVHVDDIRDSVEYFLFDETKQAINQRRVSSVSGRDYQVRYIGLKGPSWNALPTIKKLADMVNEICGAYQVVGYFAKAVKIELFQQDGDTEPQALYLSYLAFRPEAAKVIDELAELKRGHGYVEGLSDSEG